jgi:hypothetical protein
MQFAITVEHKQSATKSISLSILVQPTLHLWPHNTCSPGQHLAPHCLHPHTRSQNPPPHPQPNHNLSQ